MSAPELVNPETARTRGIWGAIHELGHNQQRSVWEFPPHTTECTCNLWSVYVHEEVLGVNRAKAHENMSVENRNIRAKSYATGGRNLENWNVWTALETYMQVNKYKFSHCVVFFLSLVVGQYSIICIFCPSLNEPVVFQLQEKFGWDAFKKVFGAYHNMTDVPNDRDGKMNLYAVTFSKVVNMNLAPFFQAWGWPIQPKTEENLSSLPVWSDHPMAQYA